MGCGRKPKNILAFDEANKSSQKPSHIIYPAVKNAKLKQDRSGTHLSWNPIEHEKLKGYNVYRFSHKTFVPKKPYNDQLLTFSEFDDQKPPKTYEAHYIIRAVFEKNDKSLEGPTSQIIIAI